MRYWLSNGDGKTYGPYELSQLRELAGQGRVRPDASVCPEGGTAWSPLAQVMTTPAGAVAGAPVAATAAPSSTGMYAGFWKRFLAYFLDSVVTLVIGMMVGFILGFVLALAGAPMKGIELAGNVVGIVIGWLYWAGMEASPKQATLGKMALGIRVTDLEGRRLSFGRSSSRYFAKIISVLTLGVGFIMAGFTQRKQALHDMLAGCLVVNNK